MKKLTSEKKQALIDAHLKSPVAVGDTVIVPATVVSAYAKDDKEDGLIVISLKPLKGITHHSYKNRPDKHISFKLSDVIRKGYGEVGFNPFEDHDDRVRNVAFSLESIMFNLALTPDSTHSIEQLDGHTVKQLSFNPYIYAPDGSKHYYQRDFCWTLEDKQLLVESLYQGIECGRVLIRKRPFDFVKTEARKGGEVAFNDVVDGKQRLDAIRGFVAVRRNLCKTRQT